MDRVQEVRQGEDLVGAVLKPLTPFVVGGDGGEDIVFEAFGLQTGHGIQVEFIRAAHGHPGDQPQNPLALVLGSGFTVPGFKLGRMERIAGGLDGIALGLNRGIHLPGRFLDDFIRVRNQLLVTIDAGHPAGGQTAVPEEVRIHTDGLFAHAVQSAHFPV